jgi:protein phosphatase 2C family protein 2/3
VRHQFDDSPDDYDLEMDNRSRAFGVRAGRIILLGDGTEVHAEQDEEELFDATEEDEDSENQVRTSSTASNSEVSRQHREDTPGPQLTHQNPSQNKDTAPTAPHVSASPSSITTDSSPGKGNEDADTNAKSAES